MLRSPDAGLVRVKARVRALAIGTVGVREIMVADMAVMMEDTAVVIAVAMVVVIAVAMAVVIVAEVGGSRNVHSSDDLCMFR